MTPYYEHGGITIYHGDCLDVLRDGSLSFDAVLGDPPYCSGGRQQANARRVFEKGADNRRESWFLTDNMGTDSYLWWMREIAGKLFTGAAVGSHLYLFTDWRQYTNVVTACESKGWALRGVVVWDKARGGAMGSFWRNNHEWVPVFSKGPPNPLPHGGFFNTWTGSKPQDEEHATVKPFGLIAYLLSATTGLVLDPWMGSGTTLFAAKAAGRRAIGIEVDERYCEMAAKQISQDVLPFDPPRSEHEQADLLPPGEASPSCG